MRELRVIARKRGVKNYENLSKRELTKEIKNLPQFKKTGFDKKVFEKYSKKDDNLELERKDIRKSFRFKKKKLIGKKKIVLNLKKKKYSILKKLSTNNH